MLKTPRPESILIIDAELKDIFPEYLQNRKQDIEIIRQNIRESNWAKIETIAHNLKGSGGGYGVEEISVVGRKIEQATKKRDVTALESLLLELKTYLETLRIEFK